MLLGWSGGGETFEKDPERSFLVEILLVSFLFFFVGSNSIFGSGGGGWGAGVRAHLLGVSSLLHIFLPLSGMDPLMSLLPSFYLSY